MKPIDEGGGGLKQTPETFGAINLGNLDADPSTATSNIGDVYYNTTSNTIKALFTDSLGGLTWNNVAYGINIDKTQVVGTAVTLADSGTITSAMIGNTQVTLSKLSTGSVNNSKVATNADIDPTKIAGTAAILGANTFTDQQTITPATSVTALVVNAASSAVGLVVKLGASGSANLTEWQNNSGTALAWVGSGGSIVSNNGSVSGVQGVRAGTSVNLATLTVIPTAVGTVGSIIRGLASQTADLTQWQDSGTTVRAQVSSAGAFTISPSSGTALTVNAASSAVGLVVKGVTSQNIQEWQRASDSTVLWYINTGGALVGNSGLSTQIFNNFYSNISSGNNAQLQLTTTGALFTTAVAANVGLKVQNANASPTGDLLQYQTSGGTVLGGRNAVAQVYSGSTAPVTVATGGAISGTSSGTTATLTSASAHGLAVGDIVTIAGMTPSGYNGTYLVATVPTTTTFTVTTSGSNLGNSTVSGTASVPAQASITARSAGTVGLVVRAASGQIANYQEWQNSSGSAFMTVFGGGISHTGRIDLGGSLRLGSTSQSLGGGAGGILAMANATTVPTSNPTGGGVLYAEGGALKWRGSSGTVTTIANA